MTGAHPTRPQRTPRVLAVVPGPDAHGVVAHAVLVAGLAGAAVHRSRTVPDTRDLARHPDGQLGWDLMHVPFTDGLWGPDAASAATAFEQWAAHVDVPVVVTLHDVPGADPDAARDVRRTAAYARVRAAADVTVVCSEQEADRLPPRPLVVPLPVEPLAAPGPRPAWADRPTVGVLGFVYPGKGHREVLEATAGAGARVVALGGPSEGHEDLVRELRERATRLGVELLVTGWLGEADLHAAARAVTVPVAAYTTTGASASLVTWAAAGRRPVTLGGPYAAELAAHWPGALLPAADLRTGLLAALADPDRTWSATPAPRPDVGALHRELYRAAAAAGRRRAPLAAPLAAPIAAPA